MATSFANVSCSLCWKFHTDSCPAEVASDLSKGLYKVKEDDEPLYDDCFEPFYMHVGAYRFEPRADSVYIYDKSGRPISIYLKRELKSRAVRREIAGLLGVKPRDVDMAVASLFLIEEEKEGREAVESRRYDPDVEEKIEGEVKRILESSNILDALMPHLNRVIVCEYDNKRAILTLLLSGKIKDPSKKCIIVVKGSEGGGKSTMASILSSFFKTKEIGRFTRHALEYTDLEEYEILYIKELGSLDMEVDGIAVLRFLSADDRGFTVEYTVRDPETGRFRTEQKRIPAMTTLSTTTKLLLERQFERRCWVFNIDESERQTERVKRWKAWIARQRDEVKLGLRRITDYEFSMEVIRRVVERMEVKDVVIPFRRSIAEALASNALRVRGDIDKIYNFIELYALFNIKRLWKINDNVYAVTPEVALEALKIVRKPLTLMVGGIDERLTPILDAMESMGLGKGDVIDKALREELAVKLGKSEETIRVYLNYLEKKLGVLSSDEKKPKTYTILYPVDTIREKTGESSVILKISDSFMEKMLKEAQIWLRLVSQKPGCAVGVKNYNNVIIFTPTGEKSISDQHLNPPEAYNQEKIQENPKHSIFRMIRIENSRNKLEEGLSDTMDSYGPDGSGDTGSFGYFGNLESPKESKIGLSRGDCMHLISQTGRIYCGLRGEILGVDLCEKCVDYAPSLRGALTEEAKGKTGDERFQTTPVEDDKSKLSLISSRDTNESVPLCSGHLDHRLETLDAMILGILARKGGDVGILLLEKTLTDRGYTRDEIQGSLKKLRDHGLIEISRYTVRLCGGYGGAGV